MLAWTCNISHMPTNRRHLELAQSETAPAEEISSRQPLDRVLVSYPQKYLLAALAGEITTAEYAKGLVAHAERQLNAHPHPY
jgi:hypothetical protein